MVVQSVSFAAHEFADILELPEAVHAGISVTKRKFILHIERLSHIKTIQPDLVWINFFVPEVSFFCTRLSKELRINCIHGFSVFFFSGQVVQAVQCFSCIDIVQIVFFGIIIFDGSVFLYEIINEFIGKLQIAFIFCDIIKSDQSFDHAAVNVIPGVRFSGADFFDIPCRFLRCAVFNQLFNVII